MIIRNTFKIHVFFYFVMFIALFTGNIRDYLIFTSIIIVHELGHIVGGCLFSWKINKVILLPFGGLTVFDNPINTSLFEQFIVTLLGPLFQIIFYFFISRLFNLSQSVIYYNYVLLLFNLLPIYPLDGSKFLYVFLNIFFPFKLSHLILVFNSFLFIVGVVVFVGRFDFLVFLVLLFLFFSVLSFFRDRDLIFNKFLYERYSYDLKFRNIRRVGSIYKMYLWCRHLIYDGKKYTSEKEFLLKRFDNHYKL